MLNIQRILFPTDLSEGARRAFPQAAYLADWHNAELHIVNVTDRGGTPNESADFPVSTSTLEMWLDQSCGADGQRPDVQSRSLIQNQLQGPVPADRIIAYAEDEAIDLFVMETHGRRGVKRILLGSVTEDVVRNGPCPVFTVRTDVDVPPDQAVRRILVPVDFSEASDAALLHGKEISQTYGAEIHLLHVVEETVYPSAYGIEPTPFPTWDVLGRVETQLGNMARDEIGYEHVTISATFGYAPTTILDYLDENDIDLVVIATHGRTGIDRILLGSVAERVIRRASTPVFVVKPDCKSLVSPS